MAHMFVRGWVATDMGDAVRNITLFDSQKLQHPLYAIHWVWGGSTLESKRQCMRDAMKFHDDPEYYTPQRLMTFTLDQLPVGSAVRNGCMCAAAASRCESCGSIDDTQSYLCCP